jgi:hypothetical protein
MMATLDDLLTGKPGLGGRAEELLELTHHSVTEYRLPSTGEVVPLLQVAPSKTDSERLLLVSPELASVLSTIVRRLRGSSRAIPLVLLRGSSWRGVDQMASSLR